MQNYLRVFFFLLIPAFVFSCVREESETGLNLQDEDTLIKGHRYDTTEVRISTIYADSAYTQKLSSAVIGYYKDSYFGSVNASLYTQIQYENQKKPDLSGYQSLDSLVFSMAFAGDSAFYPQTYAASSSATVRLVVSRLDQNLENGKNYLPSDEVSATEIISGNVSFAPRDSVMVDGKKQSAQIRIKLPDDFMQIIANNNWTTNEEFINGIRGLKVAFETSDQKMGYFNLSSVYTGLTLYYKDVDGDRKTARYLIDTSLVRFSNFTHNYTGTPLSDIKTTPVPGNSKIYLENLLGTRVKVNFPNLIAWGRNKSYAINQAILVLPVSDEIAEVNIPSGVFCYVHNEEGKVSPIIDLYSSYGVSYVPYNSSKKAYCIPVTRHVQRMLNGTYEDWGLLVLSYAERTTGNRVILKGTDSGTSGAHLEIIYTAPPEK